jgi:predicted rRNA methylase
LQLKDPWYVSSINSYSKIATQPDEFRPLSSSNYNVFLEQGGTNPNNLIPPYYSVRAPRYVADENGIYEFDEWTSPNGKANFDPANLDNYNSCAVVFTDEGAEVEAVYQAVNEIPNYTLTISQGESLTIPAGASFTCAEGFTIEVDGNLTIGSESGNRVNITGSGRSVTNELIKINNPNSNVTISNTEIQNTDCALSVEQADNVNITNTKISNVNDAINIGQTENADIALNFVQIKNSNNGILFEEGKNPLVLVLDRITDVRNFGAIARSAEVAGAHALIIPEKGGAQINADAVKTSAGALLNIPVCRVRSLGDTAKSLQRSGLRIVGASEKAEKLYHETDLSGPLAIVMGSEDAGISIEILRFCDELIKIPQHGKIESLNVSAASAVLIFEAVKQRYQQG